MITHYHRPQSLEEAVELISKSGVKVLGGGTTINRPTGGSFAVVDLQSLGLDKIQKSGDKLLIGATTTLQKLIQSQYIQEALRGALKIEAPVNLRNMKTVAGSLLSCDGRSAFAVVMLALDAKLILVGAGMDQPSITIKLGELLPFRREILRGKIVTKIEIPIQTRLAFEMVSRTPADTPIISTALAVWNSGRMRLTLGGWGDYPFLAMDGNDLNGLEPAAINTANDAGDEWASSEYRRIVSAVLAKRCLDGVSD